MFQELFFGGEQGFFPDGVSALADGFDCSGGLRPGFIFIDVVLALSGANNVTGRGAGEVGVLNGFEVMGTQLLGRPQTDGGLAGAPFDGPPDHFVA